MIHVWLDKPQSTFKVWDETNSQWEVIAGLSELNAAPFIKSNDKEVCLYLPTQSVLTLSNEVTAAQLKQLGKSGQQYLFEDLALSPVEQLQVRHLAEGAKRYFYALGQAEVEQWQQSLDLAGYKLTALLPDFVLLPSPDKVLDSEVVLYAETKSQNVSNNVQSDLQSRASETIVTLLTRFSQAQGTAVGHVSLLPRLLSNIEEIIFVSGCNINRDGVLEASNPNGHADIPDALQKIADDSGIVITPSTQVLTPVTAANKHALNFVEAKRTQLASPYLSLVASLLLLAGVIQIAADALQWYQYEQAATEVKAATNNQFNAWFSGETLNPKVDVIAQVKPRLAADAQQQSQLDIMNRVAPLIRQSQLTAESLRWNPSNIIMTVKGANREGIDRLYQGMTEQGLNANLGAVNPAAQGEVIGEITIALNTTNDANNTDAVQQ